MPDYTFKRAVREPIPLLVGLAGGTGSGKTYSALTMANGLAGDRRFALIDTEAGRALHYADRFDFDYLAIEPPFRPDTYQKAIEAAEAKGYPVIVVDSMSHEWAGDGGVLDWQEEEFERLGSREGSRLLSWKEPKLGHKRFVTRLLQLRAHLILCFRAEPKVEIVKEGNRTEVREKVGAGGYKGWLPVTEKNFPYELTCSILLMSEEPGKPHPMKVPEGLRAIFPSDRLISEATGRKLGIWAATGKVPEGPAPATAQQPEPPSEPPPASPPPDAPGETTATAFWKSVKGMGYEREQVVEHAGREDFENFTAGEFAELEAQLRDRKAPQPSLIP